MPWTRCLALPAIFADWDGSPITYRYMADLTLKERKRLGLERVIEALDCSRFARPPQAGDQLSLF